MPLMNRRDFLARAALGGIAASVSSPRIASAIDPIRRTWPSHLKLSLAAYSFRDYLAGPKWSMDLFEFINRAADMGLDAVEPTSYYFPEDVTDEYLHRLKQHAFLQGLDISGTAIRNDFCVRQEKLGKGGSHKRKPFVGTLRVTSPARQSLASGRKRVLRGVRATGTAKRRPRVSGPCD